MDPFPDEVRQFLEGNIDGMDQLEILRLLGNDSAKEWSAAQLASEAHATLAETLRHVALLESRGLVTSSQREQTVHCRYGPRTPELEAQLRLLLQLYEERPVSMIRLVYAKAQGALRTFAEAFRLRKEN